MSYRHSGQYGHIILRMDVGLLIGTKTWHLATPSCRPLGTALNFQSAETAEDQDHKTCHSCAKAIGQHTPYWRCTANCKYNVCHHCCRALRWQAVFIGFSIGKFTSKRRFVKLQVGIQAFRFGIQGVCSCPEWSEGTFSAILALLGSKSLSEH